jgi:hypothetical protein
MEEDFLYHFLNDVIHHAHVAKIADIDFIDGIMFKERVKDDVRTTFIMNFNNSKKTVHFHGNEIVLEGYECRIV